MSGWPVALREGKRAKNNDKRANVTSSRHHASGTSEVGGKSKMDASRVVFSQARVDSHHVACSRHPQRTPILSKIAHKSVSEVDSILT